MGYSRFLGVMGLLFVAATSQAAPLKCGNSLLDRRPTWCAEFKNAEFVAIGWVIQTRQEAEQPGESVIYLEHVLRSPALWRHRDHVIADRYIPIQQDKPQPYLLFGEFRGGNIDFYRGEPVTSTVAVKDHVARLSAVAPNDLKKRIEVCLKSIASCVPEVAHDAFFELNAIPLADLLRHGRTLDPKVIRKLLDDPDASPMYRTMLLVLLAACGTNEDVRIMREAIEQIERQQPAAKANPRLEPLHHALIAYTTRSPKEGFAAIHRIVANAGSDNFMTRYEGLRALRHLHDHPVKEIEPKSVLDAMALMLDQGDMADLPIEELRRWGEWDLTGKVLSYYNRPSHEEKIVQRAIIRFALSAPADHALASAFVKARLVDSPDLVKDVQQALADENKKTP